MNGAFLRIFFRIFSILFWVVIILLFLYSTRVIHALRDERSISILAWPQVIDASYLREFEKKTGIKVYISYFEHNEELIVKLRTIREHGYDLIMPSDHAAQLLIKDDLLKKIDRTRLHFWNDLYPTLLDHYFDPNNEYTIPIYWSIYGLGIDTDYFDGIPEASWALVFDENIAPEKVSLINDSRELILIAAQYLFGRIEDLGSNEIMQIKQLLKKQKKWTEIYTDMRPDLILAAKTCPVAIIPAADLTRVIQVYDNLDFLVPKEGSFVIIDSFAIPKSSKKEDLIYQFLNYIYEPEVLQKYVDEFNFFSPTRTVFLRDVLQEFSIPTPALFKKVQFFKNVVPENLLNELWISLKA